MTLIAVPLSLAPVDLVNTGAHFHHQFGVEGAPEVCLPEKEDHIVKLIRTDDAILVDVDQGHETLGIGLEGSQDVIGIKKFLLNKVKKT